MTRQKSQHPINVHDEKIFLLTNDIADLSLQNKPYKTLETPYRKDQQNHNAKKTYCDYMCRWKN